MEQAAIVDVHSETTPTTETREEFTTYDNPLVEQPPTIDTTFHFPMEGHVSSSNWVDIPSDDTEGLEVWPSCSFLENLYGSSTF